MNARAAGGWLGAGCLSISLGILGAAEPVKFTLPPPRPLDEPRKLKSELEALAAERKETRNEAANESPLAIERAKLRSDILELIKKLGEKKAAAAAPSVVAPMPMVTPTPMPQPMKPSFLLDDANASFNPLRRAQNLYKAGYHDDALKAFYLIAQDRLPREDRAFASYMSACFLRTQGKTSEAAAIFRELADSKDDTTLAEYAVSQLDIMNKMIELENLREQLRSKTKTK
jgi:hypothetical protein